LPEADRLCTALETFEADHGPLAGISDPRARDTFIARLIESERRVRYLRHIATTPRLSPRRQEPGPYFDPLKAAVLHARAGDHDEACWLVFLAIHFGKHRRAGWRYVRDVYGRLGEGGRWDWSHVTGDVDGFRAWLDGNIDGLRAEPGPQGFGNHRKYESLRATGEVVESYVAWISAADSHEERFESAVDHAGGDSLAAFDELYASMATVARFGRIARFDYLSMIARLDLAPIEPGRAYLIDSTGPLTGAQLLFQAVGADNAARALDERLTELHDHLCVGFDVIEDALCNWQKSPSAFKPFRG